MNCFTLMLTTLFISPSSNLVKLSTLFNHNVKSASSYRRIQRFLTEHVIDFNQVATFIFELFSLEKVTLTLDRTNWKWGKKTLIS
ncbi:hypothetical protein B9T25_14160 [Acinetobacter sp. ANC 4470]|nr:hypothetical protein B9T25_14160 [Acinetobacter sp. ANC 4470]